MREIAINALAQALINNQGNRITPELINGVANAVDAALRQAEAAAVAAAPPDPAAQR